MSYPRLEAYPLQTHQIKDSECIPDQNLSELEDLVKELIKETGAENHIQKAQTKFESNPVIHSPTSQAHMCSVESIVGSFLASYGFSKVTELQNSVVDFFFAQIAKPVFQMLHVEIESQHKRQSSSIKTIVSELEYRKAISLEKRLKIEQAIDANNTVELRSILLALVGNTGCNINEHRKIVELLEKNKLYEAFCYHHARLLLHEIDDTNTYEKAKKAMHECFRGEFDPVSYARLVELSSRLQCKKWLVHVFENVEAFESFEHKKELVEALTKEDDATFCRLFSEFSKKVQAESDDAIQKAFTQDLSYLFTNSAQNAIPWNDIARQILREQHIKPWENHLNCLVKELEKKSFDSLESDAHIDVERLGALFTNIVALYRHYTKLIENESVSSIPSICHAAKIGALKRSWRRINEMAAKFFRSKDCASGASHLVCDCKDLNSTIKTPQKESLKGKEKIADKTNSVVFPPLETKKEKTALFLYCNFGGGYRSAMEAVSEYITTQSEENDFTYHIKKCNVPIDVLLSKDFIHNMFGKIFNYVNGEWVYNTLLQKDRVDIIEILSQIASAPPTSEERESAKSLIRNAILKESPDIIFMMYGSFHNEYVEEVSIELGIPLVQVSTDFELSAWKQRAPTHPHFSMAVALANDKTLATLGGENSIRKDQITVTGPCVRPPFLQPLTQEEIDRVKAARNIAQDEKVLVYSSGGKGVYSDIPEIVTTGWDDNTLLHVIVITGENVSYKEHLTKELLPRLNKKNVKLDILGSCNAKQMNELMSIADVTIGKPGGLYSFEIYALGTNFLADMTSRRFSWEGTNFDVLKDLGLADSVEYKRDLVSKVKEIIKKPRIQRDFDIREVAPQRRFAELSSKLIKESESDANFIEKRRMWSSAEILRI